MISVKGQLFIICSDFTVVQDEEGFYGIGSGGAYAVGALYAGSTPEDAIRTAMKFDVNTGGNIQIMKQVRNA
jgi:ATP-dependent protease HslVU (ClpYQ) peptidase subunit